CGSSIGIDESRKRLHEMPGWAVHSRFVARVNVLLRPAPPTLAAGGDLTFNDAFRAERDRYLAIESLRCVRHEDANALFERSLDFRLIDNLLEVRRSDFLFAFSHENQIERELPAGAADGMERRKKRRLRPLLIHSAAANKDFAEPRFIDNGGIP